MKCISVLRFNSSAPFISSPSILFRPIHPIAGLRCRCPVGFTGDYCETEINLCYSNPCLNGGVCARREGGYTCICREDYTGEHGGECVLERGSVHVKCCCGEGVCMLTLNQISSSRIPFWMASLSQFNGIWIIFVQCCIKIQYIYNVFVIVNLLIHFFDNLSIWQSLVYVIGWIEWPQIWWNGWHLRGKGGCAVCLCFAVLFNSNWVHWNWLPVLLCSCPILTSFLIRSVSALLSCWVEQHETTHSASWESFLLFSSLPVN